MSISDVIFNKMSEKKITQKEFSKRTNIPESTISDWKKKGNTPGAEKLTTIVAALGISVSELLGEDKCGLTDYCISEEEKMIIDLYRNSSADVRRRIIAYLEKMSHSITNREVSDDDVSTQYYALDDELLNQKQLAHKLRRLARLDRIRLDESEHLSKYNLHLLKYLDYVGLDKLDYIKKYLSNIQPFMIIEIKSQEKFDNAICVLDNYYRISVYIKVDATRGEEVVVSFHENNKNGIAKKNSTFPTNRYVYVFAESIGSYVETKGTYTINLFITRGVSTFPINVPATKYDEEGFVVRYTYINNALVDIANNYLEDLYTADLDFDMVNVFTSLQQLSFSSYGNDAFSNISLMIDSLLIQNDYSSRQIADSALCIYCNSLQLTKSDRQELLDTLRERFKVNSVKALPQIIERVEMNLGS